MKNLLKSFVVILLSMMLICGFAGHVFADSNIDWDDPGIVGGTNTSNNTTNTNLSNNTNLNSVNTNTNISNSNNNTNNTNTSANVNNNSKASNELAYTGIESVNGIVAVIAVLGAFVAVYSFRKIQDYKNIK